MIIPDALPDANDVARHYDSLDFFYRDTWGRHVHHGYWETGSETTEEAVDHLTRTVVGLAGVKPRSRVCDVGCGYGGTSWHMAREFGARVSAFTLSEAQASEAAAFGERIPAGEDTPIPEFLTRNWLDNGLAEESIDALVSIECVSHVDDKPGFFSEIARVLRPGGRAAVCAWLSAESPSKWARRRLLEPICFEGRLPSLCARSEYEAMVRDAGLEVVEFRQAGAQVRKTWRIVLQRLASKLVTDSRYRKFLLSNLNSDRIFALTVPRLLLAYHAGALDYGIFTARK